MQLWTDVSQRFGGGVLLGGSKRDHCNLVIPGKILNRVEETDTSAVIGRVGDEWEYQEQSHAKSLTKDPCSSKLGHGATGLDAFSAMRQISREVFRLMAPSQRHFI